MSARAALALMVALTIALPSVGTPSAGAEPSYDPGAPSADGDPVAAHGLLEPAGEGPAVDYQAAPYFQAMSLNVAGVARDWYHGKLSAIGNRIIASTMEVVAFQEICQKQLDAVLNFVNDYYRGTTVFYAYHGRAFYEGTTECDYFGNGIMTLHRDYNKTYPLPTPTGEEQRVDACTTTSAWGKRIRACSTHLSTDADGGAAARRPQIDWIENYCADVGGTMGILQLGDFNATAPDEGTEMKGLTGITGLLGEADDRVTAANPYAWSHTYDDTPGGADVKIDYVLYGRYYLGSTLNYDLHGTKFGPGRPDEADEFDFDHQALIPTRMFVR